MKKLSLLLLPLLLNAPAFAAEWEIDAGHTSAGFAIRHMMVSNVRGQFADVKGTVQFDPAQFEKTSVNATINAASVNTNSQKRDDHLRNEDFFDVVKFPTMTFVSDAVKKTGEGTFDMQGKLTIRGVTKDITLKVEGPTAEVKDPWGNTRIGATATTKINRKDFGLTWNKVIEAGGVAVGDEVQVTIDLELIKKTEAVAKN